MLCEKRCACKLHKIHRKTPVPESLFKKSCRSEGCHFIKKETPAHVFSCEFRFLRTPYLQNTSARLLLILSVASFLYFPLSKIFVSKNIRFVRKKSTSEKAALIVFFIIPPQLPVKSSKYLF